MSVNVDVKDKRILFELDSDCRQSNAQLAKKVGLSKDAVAYRIRQLEKKGVISGYRLLYNANKIGLVQHRVALRLIDVNSKSLSELMNYLIDEKNVRVLGKNEGEWDLAFVFMSKTSVEFFDFFEQFMARFRRLVKDKMIGELLKYDEFPRAYLIDAKKKNYEKALFDVQNVPVDELDMKIIIELSKNSRAKMVDVAATLSISSMLLIQRIKKLEEKKVIIGYKADIHVLSLGRDYYGIKINLSDYSQKENILTRVHALPETTAIIYAIAGYDIEFDVELLSTKDYHKLITMLRNEFSTIREIKSIRAIEYFIG